MVGADERFPRFMKAVVFAYHNVGARCLRVLLAHHIEVALVVTHHDNPQENIWFESVAGLAREYDIPVAMPEDPNSPDFIAQLRALDADFFFSFYYRLMLSPALLALPRCGGYNLHGSLLPKYRGRVPVNWAIIHGERETGATLHRMVEKPDAGEIVAQQAIPILPDDTALDVFSKVTWAAELALDNALPGLMDGTAPHVTPDLTQGSYFSGRRPEDGRIDWQRNASDVHNLIRAVAPPYPGAFCDIAGHRVIVTRSQRVPYPRETAGKPQLHSHDGRLVARCGDGGLVKILSLTMDGESLAPSALLARLGANPLPLS